ncbi:hypothetical protein DFH09DRAFT_499649 [Mycena vulgaris]|nr:hypothetical protein DFH09DRAFT_499649 [Mycena vulgaris]
MCCTSGALNPRASAIPLSSSRHSVRRTTNSDRLISFINLGLSITFHSLALRRPRLTVFCSRRAGVGCAPNRIRCSKYRIDRFLRQPPWTMCINQFILKSRCAVCTNSNRALCGPQSLRSSERGTHSGSRQLERQRAGQPFAVFLVLVLLCVRAFRPTDLPDPGCRLGFSACFRDVGAAALPSGLVTGAWSICDWPLFWDALYIHPSTRCSDLSSHSAAIDAVPSQSCIRNSLGFQEHCIPGRSFIARGT